MGRKTLCSTIEQLGRLHNRKKGFPHSTSSCASVQLLVVGRAYREDLVDERVLKSFREVVHLLPPSAAQRRLVFRDVWTDMMTPPRLRLLLQEEEDGLPAAGDRLERRDHLYELYALDHRADGCIDVPLISLIFTARAVVESILSNVRRSKLLGNADCSLTLGRQSVSMLSRVSGLSAVKQALIEAVFWPRQHASLFRSFVASCHRPEASNEAVLSVSGILLFGPPGEVMRCLDVDPMESSSMSAST